MPSLRSKNLEPKNGWRYLQAETQLWIEGSNWWELVDKVIDHRTYKGLMPQDKASVAADIEEQLCMVLGAEWCYGNKGEEWKPYVDVADGLGMQKVIGISSFMLELVRSNEPLVDKTEAERRANICKSCPFNKKSNTCVCTPIYKTMAALIPKERQIEGLQICGICGCMLQLKVLMPQSVIVQDNENKQRRYPDYCWQNHGKELQA